MDDDSGPHSAGPLRHPGGARATRGPAFAALGVTLGLLAVATGACLSNPTKDAHCSPDAPSIDVDPDCIYAGDGRGPAFLEDACAAPSGAKPANCAATFGVVFEMMNDSQRGNCASTACHGYEPTAAQGLFLDSGDPESFYEALTGITGSVGAPYVVADDPSTPENEAAASWIQCNVAGKHGGGYPMPPWSGLGAQADIDAVTAWILCGAPGP